MVQHLSGGGGAYNGNGGAASPVTSPVQGYAGGTGATQAGLPGPADQGGGGGGALEQDNLELEVVVLVVMAVTDLHMH